MSKAIEIAFCAENGLGGPANKLKKSIQQAFPGTEVNCVESNEGKNRIEVSWVNSGVINMVWSNNKTDT